jgi:hypothetical protein
MPHLWSALLHLHLPWETTDKIPVIVAEGLNTVLVATLARSKKRLRALRIVAPREIVGYTGSLQAREQRIGEGLFVLALLAILWLWQRAEPGAFMLAILLAFLATTAGFGVQYLCWPLPLANRVRNGAYLAVHLACLGVCRLHLSRPPVGAPTRRVVGRGGSGHRARACGRPDDRASPHGRPPGATSSAPTSTAADLADTAGVAGDGAVRS